MIEKVRRGIGSFCSSRSFVKSDENGLLIAPVARFVKSDKSDSLVTLLKRGTKAKERESEVRIPNPGIKDLF